ncbi:protein NETWORKED 4B-like [Iris pallida]|uniref:Protein NETWORKED 4B-like n=1 Tax=Iris pallida TaxID=29817 RepID=A0AAX6EIP6_IRIPA|nr:protein NETWORKED 4B-like [Iris pallida]
MMKGKKKKQQPKSYRGQSASRSVQSAAKSVLSTHFGSANAKSEIMSLHQKLLEENNLSSEASSIDLRIDNTIVSGMETQEVESATKLSDREREVEDLKGLISAKDQENEAEESEKSSQDKLCLVDADIIDLKEVINELKSEMTKISKRFSLQQNLVEEFKATSAVSADRFSLEESALKTEISIPSLSNSSLSAKLVQLEAEKAVLCSDRDRLKLQVDTLTAEKDEMAARVGALGGEAKSRDDRICSMDEHVSRPHLEHVELIAEIEQARRAGRELADRVKELDEVVESQRAAVSGAERSREETRRDLSFMVRYQLDNDHLRDVLFWQKSIIVLVVIIFSIVKIWGIFVKILGIFVMLFWERSIIVLVVIIFSIIKYWW